MKHIFFTGEIAAATARFTELVAAHRTIVTP